MNINVHFRGVEVGAVRETQRGARFVVFDDFLSTAGFDAAVQIMERAALSERVSAICPADGPAYRSRGLSFPADDDRPEVVTGLAAAVRAEPDLLGTGRTDWARVAFTFWQHPAGSRHSWHSDSGPGRRGEFILFTHRYWDMSWGGELMVLDRDPDLLGTAGPDGDDTGDNPAGDAFTRVHNVLRSCEVDPVTILPRPNRLVLLRSNTLHTVRRVDRTAGGHLRCTLNGFVHSEPPAPVRLPRARRELSVAALAH